MHITTVIAEVVKHLPGRHSQDNHAGSVESAAWVRPTDTELKDSLGKFYGSYLKPPDVELSAFLSLNDAELKTALEAIHKINQLASLLKSEEAGRGTLYVMGKGNITRAALGVSWGSVEVCLDVNSKDYGSMMMAVEERVNEDDVDKLVSKIVELGGGMTVVHRELSLAGSEGRTDVLESYADKGFLWYVDGHNVGRLVDTVEIGAETVLRDAGAPTSVFKRFKKYVQSSNTAITGHSYFFVDVAKRLLSSAGVDKEALVRSDGEAGVLEDLLDVYKYNNGYALPIMELLNVDYTDKITGATFPIGVMYWVGDPDADRTETVSFIKQVRPAIEKHLPGRHRQANHGKKEDQTRPSDQDILGKLKAAYSPRSVPNEAVRALWGSSDDTIRKVFADIEKLTRFADICNPDWRKNSAEVLDDFGNSYAGIDLIVQDNGVDKRVTGAMMSFDIGRAWLNYEDASTNIYICATDVPDRQEILAVQAALAESGGGMLYAEDKMASNDAADRATMLQNYADEGFGWSINEDNLSNMYRVWKSQLETMLNAVSPTDARRYKQQLSTDPDKVDDDFTRQILETAGSPTADMMDLTVRDSKIGSALSSGLFLDVQDLINLTVKDSFTGAVLPVGSMYVAGVLGEDFGETVGFVKRVPPAESKKLAGGHYGTKAERKKKESIIADITRDTGTSHTADLLALSIPVLKRISAERNKVQAAFTELSGRDEHTVHLSTATTDSRGRSITIAYADGSLRASSDVHCGYDGSIEVTGPDVSYAITAETEAVHIPKLLEKAERVISSLGGGRAILDVGFSGSSDKGKLVTDMYDRGFLLNLEDSEARFVYTARDFVKSFANSKDVPASTRKALADIDHNQLAAAIFPQLARGLSSKATDEVDAACARLSNNNEGTSVPYVAAATATGKLLFDVSIPDVLNLKIVEPYTGGVLPLGIMWLDSFHSSRIVFVKHIPGSVSKSEGAASGEAAPAAPPDAPSSANVSDFQAEYPQPMTSYAVSPKKKKKVLVRKV